MDYENGLFHIYTSKTQTDRWVLVSDELLERLSLHQAQSNCEYIVSYVDKQNNNLHKTLIAACLRAGITEPARMYGNVSRSIGHTRVSTTTDVYLEVLSKEIYDVE